MFLGAAPDDELFDEPKTSAALLAERQDELVRRSQSEMGGAFSIEITPNWVKSICAYFF